MAGLSIKKGKRKGEWSVYKYNVALFTGITSREMAVRIKNNQAKREAELRK